MTNITKAAQDALEVTLYECVACEHLYQHKVSQCDCLENHDNEYREWIAKPKATNSAALQYKAGEVQKMDTETLRSLVAGLALEIDPDADLERYPEALGFQIDMARAVMRSTKPAQVVPDGFELVPVVATFGMRAAGNIELDRLKNTPGMLVADRAFYVWSAMIAASQQKGGSAG